MAKQSGNAVCFHDGKKTSRMSPAVLKTKSFVVTPSPEPSDKQSAKSAAARDAVPLPTVETSQNCFGLPNRTMFCNNVRTRISESKRSGAPFSILLLKLRLREKLTSEDAGTVPAAVLQKSASLIQSVVREMDSIAYYGQACFSILMPGVDPSASQDLAQRLQVQLSHLSTNSTQVDLVVGIATVGQGDDTVSLLKRAEIDLQRNQPTACLRG
jgi:diguanylate cyclase (GGDEF)-like protein